MGARFFLFCRQFSKRARTSSSLAGVVGAAVNFIGPPVFQGFRPTVPQLKIFFMHACRKGTMTTAAAIDRVVHHSVILELNLPSYRMEQAEKRKNTNE